MRWLFRPSVLIGVSVVLVAAAALVFRAGPGIGRPVPLPLREGDTEIVWLYPATNTSAWERFVSAVRRAHEELRRDFPGLPVPDDAAAFPQETAEVPQVTLAWPGLGRRLLFRWYKVTRDWKAGDWVDALVRGRRRPPLAIVGGGTSYWARELALELRRAAADLPEAERPLFLVTTATADRVQAPDDLAAEAGAGSNAADTGLFPAQEPGEEGDLPPLVPLQKLYPGRTFRFCFTNRQMATAITRFIWSRDELRPDRDPVYVVRWRDDSYSRDLQLGYGRALPVRVGETMARQWAWWSGCMALGAFPPGLAGGPFPYHLVGRHRTDLRLETVSGRLEVDSSVGSFASPNPDEARMARYLIEQVRSVPAVEGGAARPTVRRRPPRQKQALLVVTGQVGPSRRLLREVARSAPEMTRRFVVATGDAISFNTIYRDGLVTWPIQDLPFKLVLFCHANPVDTKAGFRPLRAGLASPGAPGAQAKLEEATGTEDLLLFSQMVAALAHSFARAGQPCADAGELGRRLAQLRLRGGQVGFDREGALLFRPDGCRHDGTGEHVVYLRPRLEVKRDAPGSVGELERVLPQAAVEVWAWQTGRAGHLFWRRCGDVLPVSYEEPSLEGAPLPGPGGPEGEPASDKRGAP
jgi:hypothetical protein